jgi:hypothetical protein
LIALLATWIRRLLMNRDALRAARNIASGRGPTTGSGVLARREGTRAVARALAGGRRGRAQWSTYQQR